MATKILNEDEVKESSDSEESKNYFSANNSIIISIIKRNK